MRSTVVARRPGVHLMIVCVCERVSDRDIERHVRGGCDSFDSLQLETGVATCCGRCEDCAREVFETATGAQGGMVIIPLKIAA
jgi:bacterioferritin-associated ferredoxin